MVYENGRAPRRPPNPTGQPNQQPPYVLNNNQRRIILLVHQRRCRDIESVCVAIGVSRPTDVARIQRTIDTLTPAFISQLAESQLSLTPRAQEIAENVLAASTDTNVLAARN